MKIKPVTLSLLTTLMLGFYSQEVAPAQRLPDMGSSTSRTLSLSQEQAMGDNFILAVRQMLPLVEDPLVVEYINNLGFRIVEQNEDAHNRRFYFFVVQDPTLNAFALPGGYVGFHTGLIVAADNESELAGVMGHEVAHVTQRHLARRMEKQQQMSIPSLATFLGAILIATQNPQAGIGLATTAQAGFKQAIINHTRENEKEADRIGMRSVSKAGYDPLAISGFFEKVQLATRYLRRPPEYLMTHPVTQNRIADARARARSLPPPRRPDSLQFQLIKIRLGVAQEETNSERYYENQKLFKAGKIDNELMRYLFSLQSYRNQDFATAIAIQKELLSVRPRNMTYLVSLSESLTANGQAKEAIPLLEHELQTTPTSYPLIMTYARALIDNEQPVAARALLLEHAHREDAEPQIFQLLGEAQNKAGFTDEVHESRGQFLYAMGDLQGALTQFDLAAQRQSDDPYSLTRVQARIEQIQALILKRRNAR